VAYDRKVRARLGDRADERFRLYWTDQATHIPSKLPWSIDYSGLIEQGLLDMVQWVEDGVSPPQSSAYRWSEDSTVVLSSEALERLGIQPTVQVSANGATTAEIKAGDEVRFSVAAEAPPHCGAPVCVEWDFDGSGQWPLRQELGGEQSKIVVEATRKYVAPGTYMATARVTTHRSGDPNASVARVQNQARCRVVVTA